MLKPDSTRLSEERTVNFVCFFVLSLHRYRLSEISFVLKAVATLVISLKKAPPEKGKVTE
jgi:hypothetical protein